MLIVTTIHLLRAIQIGIPCLQPRHSLTMYLDILYSLVQQQKFWLTSLAITPVLIFLRRNYQVLLAHTAVLSQLGSEDAISRVYGGVHNDLATQDGVKIGENVGYFVFNNVLK